MKEINMTKEFKNILEDISSSQMARLKKEYEPLRKIDMSKHKGQIDKTIAMLRKLKMGTLIDLSKEDIPVISGIAKALVSKDKRFAHHVEEVNEEVGDSHWKRDWKNPYTRGALARSLAKKFRKNEDENRHTENYLLLAKAFGTSSEIRKVKDIIKRNKTRGYTSTEDNKWMATNLGKHFRAVRLGEELDESLIVGLNKSSAEYKAGKAAAKKGIKYDDNPHEPGVKRLNWSTGHNDFRADALRKAGKPNYGARGQFEEVELKEFTISDVKDMARKKWIAEPTPEQMKELQKINHKNNGNITRKDLNDVGVATLGIASEADLTKTQIKMVHDKADELPKQDFIKRYGKDGDSVRYATATNIVKKKLGIGEEVTEETSPEVANVLKKYVTGHPLRWSTRQGVKNRKDFETLQALALKDMTAFRSKFNDMKAKPGEDNYQQAAVRAALAKAGLSRHLTDENKIEGDEIMNESYKDKFNAQMKKAGIDSLDDLKTDAEKKAFFKAVDKSHTADHEEVKEDRGFSSAQIKQAYGVLNDPRYKQGNYSGAVKAIEKIAKGLSDHPDVANALKRANEDFNIPKSKAHLIKPVKELPPIKGLFKIGKSKKVGVPGAYRSKRMGEDHDCDNEHPGVSHEAWKSKKKLSASYESKEKNEMKQESKKYHETKPGSIQDAVAQMQVNETKDVTIKVKELSALIETYLNKGGVSHNLSPVIAEKELSGVLPLQAVREFIGTYNRHFLTNYKAEEFIVREG